MQIKSLMQSMDIKMEYVKFKKYIKICFTVFTYHLPYQHYQFVMLNKAACIWSKNTVKANIVRFCNIVNFFGFNIYY